jgi:hypothetical protein
MKEGRRRWKALRKERNKKETLHRRSERMKRGKNEKRKEGKE